MESPGRTSVAASHIELLQRFGLDMALAVVGADHPSAHEPAASP
jgi:hypothetical protein